MPSHEDRKKAIKAYKEQDEIGGLYRFVNTKTGWQSPVMGTLNLQGIQNRFRFAQKTNACFDTALAKQWAEHGPDAFAFVEIEALKKKPEQTRDAFRDELEALLALYEEDAQ